MSSLKGLEVLNLSKLNMTSENCPSNMHLEWNVERERGTKGNSTSRCAGVCLKSQWLKPEN